MTTQEELNQINNKIIKKYEELVAVQDRLIDNLEKAVSNHKRRVRRACDIGIGTR